MLNAIELTNLCLALNALPLAGGVKDQDSYDMYVMRSVLAAQNEKAELDRKRKTRGGV